MSVRIIAVGKKHESWVVEGIERYEKRLKPPFSCEWLLLSHSSRQNDAARDEESGRILERIKTDDFVVLLDEHGTLYDSLRLSKLFIAPLERSQNMVVIIGGAYGVNGAMHARANIIWSLSPLVFPHQLVRLIVAEQLYRTQEIVADRPYHHV